MGGSQVPEYLGGYYEGQDRLHDMKCLWGVGGGRSGGVGESAILSVWLPSILSSLSCTPAFSSHVPSSFLAHTFKVMIEVLWCHTWSSVSTIQWDRCRDPIDPRRGNGRGSRYDWGDETDSGRPRPKGWQDNHKRALSDALKQCVDNSIILKIHVSSTEEQEKNWGSERGKMELSEKNSVTVWVEGG